MTYTIDFTWYVKDQRYAMFQGRLTAGMWPCRSAAYAKGKAGSLPTATKAALSKMSTISLRIEGTSLVAHVITALDDNHG